MKYIIPCILLAASIMLSGCDQSDGGKTKTNNASTVDQILSTQTNASTEEETEVISENTEERTFLNSEAVQTLTMDSEVDYDLTTMSSDMVYATVYQMLSEPDEYLGKTVRMSGQYYTTYYNVTGLYYHYCIISDATACCAQGLEFIWEDGSHSYPEEYPEAYSEITLVGTFSVYEEEGILYYFLENSVMEQTKK